MNGEWKQQQKGTEQFLKVGDKPNEALEAFIDDQDSIRDS